MTKNKCKDVEGIKKSRKKIEEMYDILLVYEHCGVRWEGKWNAIVTSQCRQCKEILEPTEVIDLGPMEEDVEYIRRGT